jgi:hypothetical protein
MAIINKILRVRHSKLLRNFALTGRLTTDMRLQPSASVQIPLRGTSDILKMLYEMFPQNSLGIDHGKN